MALEAVLKISATDGTAAVLAELKKRIEGIEKSAGKMDTFVSAVGKVTKSVDPMA